MVTMTDLNPRRPHVTRHEIYTLIPHLFHLIFIFISINLVICLFVYFYLIILFLSGYCQLLFSSIKVYFCAWLHEVIPNSNLYWRPTEKLTNEASLLKLHILCNYVLKENSHEALPKSRCCSVITLSCFNYS